MRLESLDLDIYIKKKKKSKISNELRDETVVFGAFFVKAVSTFFPPSVYWDYAITIRLEEIVYLHCHQQGLEVLFSEMAVSPVGFICAD